MLYGQVLSKVSYQKEKEQKLLQVTQDFFAVQLYPLFCKYYSCKM